MRISFAVSLVALGCFSCAPSGWQPAGVDALDSGPANATDSGVTNATPPTRGVGRIQLINRVRQGAFLNEFEATFLPRAWCTEEAEDHCVLRECSHDGGMRSESAGSLSVTGHDSNQGIFNLAALPLTDPFRYRNASPRPVQLWDGGEALTLRATGDVVPAFEATVLAPTPAEVTVDCSSTSCAGLQAGASTGTPFIELESRDLSGAAQEAGELVVTLRCEASPGSHEVAVSPRLFARLPPNTGFRYLGFVAGVSQRTRQVVGDYEISFEAQWLDGATSPDPSP